MTHFNLPPVSPSGFRLKNLRSLALISVASLGLAACDGPMDLDFRDLGGDTLDTTQAVQNMPNRPRPDNRGVISYPNYQVVVAQRGDTINAIAGRLNLNADELARYNGIQPDTSLRRDEVIALPRRVAEPTVSTGAVAPAQGGDFLTSAGAAIDRAGTVTTTPLTPTTTAAAATAPAVQPSSSEPIRHQVQRGETAYSVARLYNVPVRNIAEWNGLGADLSVREGQQLLVPQGGGSPPPQAIATQPGQGTVTPVPPSAATPLPAAITTPVAAAPAAAPAPAPAAAPTPAPAAAAAATSSARFAAPVSGSIIRAFNPPSSQGIDFGVAAGTTVKAADSGTVAAVTTDTNGVAIVVIRHSGNLLTVYTNLENLTVARGDSVSRGQAIGKVKAGSPAFLHFEVRQGTSAVDPSTYLP